MSAVEQDTESIGKRSIGKRGKKEWTPNHSRRQWWLASSTAIPVTKSEAVKSN